MGLLTLSCTNLALEETERAKSELIGLAKADLLSCAGIPDDTLNEKNNKQFLSYSSEKTVNVPTPYPTRTHLGFGVNRRYGYSHYPFGFYSVPATQQENRICTITFTLEADLVTSLTYRLNDGDRVGMQQCYQIVKNCLPEKPK